MKDFDKIYGEYQFAEGGVSEAFFLTLRKVALEEALRGRTQTAAQIAQVAELYR